MLEKLVTTLTLSSVALTLGGGYAWAQGAFDPQEADLGPVAEQVVAPGGAGAGSGYGFGIGSGYGDYLSAATPSPTTAPARRQASPDGAPAPWEPVSLLREPSAVSRLLAAGGSSGVPLAPMAGSGTATSTAPVVGTVPDPVAGSSTAPSDPSDPSAPSSDPAPASGGSGGADFRVASFNVLGSSLTKPGGASPGYAPGTTRIAGAVRLLEAQRVSVVGLQELQPDQAAVYQRMTPGWETWPGTSMAGARSGAESLSWDTAVWTPVEKHRIAIPFMSGIERQMPYVLLQHRATGKRVWFTNVHQTPHRGARNEAFRQVGTDRQVALVKRLAATGHEQVVTGDMNSHRSYFCRMTSETPLRAAAGGSNSGGRCTPPSSVRIDWILGSPGLDMHDHLMLRDAAVKAITDHPVAFADVDFR